MKRRETKLLAPHRALGLVCSDGRSCYQPYTDRRSKGELSCVVDNMVCTYILQPLRLKYISNPLSKMIDLMARDHYRIFAVTGSSIHVMSRIGEVQLKLKLDSAPKFLLPFGEALVVADAANEIHIFDLENGEQVLEIASPESFKITAIAHPASYLDQIVVGGEDGRMRLLSIKSGELVREYPNDERFNCKITVLEQSPAVDVLAVGMENGRVHLRNLKADQTICSFRQDGSITAIAFRSDGTESMVTGNSVGDVAVWDLNERMLVGQKCDAHKGPVGSLHFMLGQPYLISTGVDNRLMKWVLRNENSLPEVHTAMEGHSEPVNCLSFFDGCSILSAGEDGCVRQFDSIQQNVMKSYGLAREVKKQDLSKDRFVDSRLSPAIQLEVSRAREAVWDNVICRHQDSPMVSTWSTRRCTRGSHLLYHTRFKHNPKYLTAVATSMFISSCGNFALIGYSSGHLDVFNMQSGKWRNSFWYSQAAVKDEKKEEGVKDAAVDEDDKVAHSASVTGVAMDLVNRNVVSGSADGYIHFWTFNPPKIFSRINVGVSIVKFRLDALNSLLAVALANGELLVVDVLCRRIARRFKDAHAGARVTVLEFSPDGRWLVSADDYSVLKIWNLTTSSLVDVMKSSRVCLDASFSDGGEYLATAHHGQKAVYVWANKALFVSGHVPEQLLKVPEDGDVKMVELGDDEKEEQLEEGLVSLSGLPATRWANLPILDMIRQRNKPVEPPKKPKAAPFFLPTTDSLGGFAFEKIVDADEGDAGEDGEEMEPEAKRKLQLSNPRTPWVQSLMSAEEDSEKLVACFAALKRMGPSSIDFQIRSIDAQGEMVQFVRMLCAVLETRRDFELVQSYMATFFNAHAGELWSVGGDELTQELERLLGLQDEAWAGVQDLLDSNASLVQWIRSALV